MFWIPGWASVAGAHWWENFYFWASIVALILLGITEIISHRYTERKDELAAIEQASTQDRHAEEMARLHLQTAELTADAEKSRAAIAEATARAADANRVAEGERLARVKLETQLARRRLTDDQKSKLANALARLRLQIPSISVARLGDKEAHEYAEDFLLVLNNAGISPSLYEMGSQNIPRYGLKVTEELKPAFDEAEIKIDAILSSGQARLPTIFVGLKPPAF
jgi:hypothetical protein